MNERQTERLSCTYYENGCEAIEKGKGIPAKAFFLEAINTGELSQAETQIASSRLAEIWKFTEQNLEAIAWFTKAILSGSEEAAEGFLNNTFFSIPLFFTDNQIKLLSLCSFIVLKESGYLFRDLDLLHSDWYTKHIGDVKIISNSSLHDFKIANIVVNLEKYDAETALKFFEYCLFNKIITPGIYRDIILHHGNITNAKCTDKIACGLFLSFLLENLQEAKNHLYKLLPEMLHSNFSVLQNMIETNNDKKIRDELNYIIFERLLINQNYCNAATQCFKTISHNFIIPIKLLEKYYLNIYMINDDYDIFKLRELVLNRLREHSNKLAPLSTFMSLENITDEDKMRCAIRHAFKLLSMIKVKKDEKPGQAKNSVYEFMGTIFGATITVDEQIIEACLKLGMDVINKMENTEKVVEVGILLEDFYQIVQGKKSNCTEKAIVQILYEVENVLMQAIIEKEKTLTLRFL